MAGGMAVLVTGAAGFIGSATSRALLERGHEDVVGIDNLNEYYDPKLKQARLDSLASSSATVSVSSGSTSPTRRRSSA